MSSGLGLESIEETKETEKFSEVKPTEGPPEDSEDYEFGQFRIESVDDDGMDMMDNNNAGNRSNPMVFKRAHTVMLTNEMQWFDDDYMKLEPLGEPGTFGMAFKCYKRTDDTIFYAAKQINKAKFYMNDESKGVLENMKNEIQIMNILSSHPHICKLHETKEDRNYIYLILDFLSGGELYGRIEENEELEEKEAQRITKQILSAVEFMQKHNIAHLDLKPDNILFENKNKESDIRLIDFGEAKIVKPNQKLNQKIGTPYYMAPEMLNEIPYDAFKADMWSIGVITFCMLFGFVPFHADDEEEIFKKIKQGFNPQVLDGYGAFFPKDIPISDNARNFIGGLLNMDPIKRLSVKDCLNHPWIKGETIKFLTKSKSTKFNAEKVKKQQSMKKLFLIMEDPIDIDNESDEDVDDNGEVDDDVDDDKKQDNDIVIISAPQNGIIKKGYLKKEGKVFKSWKKRWFILQNNGIVSYYPSHKEVDKPLGEFSVQNYTELFKSNKVKHGIILCTLQRNWKFICKDDKQRMEWMNAFEKAKNKANKIKNGKLKVNTVNGQEMRRIRGSMDQGHNYQHQQHQQPSGAMSPTLLVRDQKITEKVEQQIDQQMENMMNDLQIPQNARKGMMELDKDRKIGLIQQHKFKKLMENNNKRKKRKKTKTKETKSHSKSVGYFGDNPESNNSHKQPKINNNINGNNMIKKTHTQSSSDEFNKNSSLLLPISTRPISQSVIDVSNKPNGSLAGMSFDMARIRSTIKTSEFKDKHIKIMNQLKIAAKARIKSIEQDKDIINYVEKAFTIQQNEEKENDDNNNDNNNEEKEEEGIQMKRSNTMDYEKSNGSSVFSMDSHFIKKSQTIHFGRDEIFGKKNQKYVCKVIDNKSFDNLLDAIEFMLKQLWDKEYTKLLYQQLVKKISLTHKAKMFSIGADRKTRSYFLKKYQNCFVGSEGIDWLILAKFVKNTDDRRERAKDLGNSFYTKGWIKHVAGQHKFKDEKLWYVFDDQTIDKQCLIEDNHSFKPSRPTNLTQSQSNSQFVE